MNAGRELDALVAEKVMGETPGPITVIDGRGTRSDIGTTRDYVMPGGREGRQAIRTPDYSTDIAAAWQVVEKLHPTLWCRIQTGRPLVGAPKAMGCTVWLGEYGESNAVASGTADSVPLAICRAALVAARREVPA